MATRESAPKWRKLVTSLLVGGVSGFLGASAMMYLIGIGALGDLGASQLAAAGVALIYVLMAVGILVGLASPAAGARFLNVEDADELLEQRRVLLLSSVAMVAWGLLMFVLAASGEGGILASGTALALVAVLVSISVVLGIAQWRQMDELMRSVTNEVGNLSYYLVLIAGGGWAIAAHLGFASAPAPLDWLTMLSGLVLLASFIAAGRRGLLTPR